MKILIDTSFILPPLGIDVGESVLNIIKEFDKHEIYFIRKGVKGAESLARWIAPYI
jgi:hypothetical protein